jgi:hypothetical protein
MKRRRGKTDILISPHYTRLRDRLFGEAFAYFEENILPQSSPDVFSTQMQKYFTVNFLSPDFLQEFCGSQIPSTRIHAMLPDIGLYLDKHPLQLPSPVYVTTGNKRLFFFLIMLSTALAGLAGAIIFNLAFNHPEFGLLLGCPLGAGLCYYVLDIFRNRPLLAGLLNLEEKNFQRSEYMQTMSLVMKGWMDYIFLAFWIFFQRSLISGKRTGPDENVNDEIAKYLYKLHACPAKELPGVAAELIERARSLGIDGLEGAPAFLAKEKQVRGTMVWHDGLEEKYRTFGDIQEGDTVFVEEKPLIRHGTIISKGLVRKIRI